MVDMPTLIFLNKKLEEAYDKEFAEFCAHNGLEHTPRNGYFVAWAIMFSIETLNIGYIKPVHG